MASLAPQSVPLAAIAQLATRMETPAQRAIFTLLKPVKAVVDGDEVELSGIEMRALDTADLPLLDQFHGQPIALAQNIVATLCDLTIDQVQQLDLEDFTMLASDALFEVEQVSIELGLRPDFFLSPPAVGEDA